MALLEAMNAAEFDLAMATAAERLGAWPDDTRAAPGEDWRRAQTGALPRWWPLVRHVRAMNDDRLDAAAALAPLTSVDASDVDVDPAPLAKASRLRRLNLAGNRLVGSLDFVRGTPALERPGLARQELALDLAPLARLRHFTALNLGFREHFEDCPAPRPALTLPALEFVAPGFGTKVRDPSPLRGLPLRYVSLTGCKANIDVSPLPQGCEVAPQRRTRATVRDTRASHREPSAGVEMHWRRGCAPCSWWTALWREDRTWDPACIDTSHGWRPS